MGSYKLKFKKSVEKDLRKLDKFQVSRILSLIETLKETPLPANTRKLVGSSHTFRLRVGDYRVIYFVLEEKLEIEIQKIRHRKEVYR